jgi:ComF family protein
MSFTSVWRGLLDLVAPRRCAACDEPLDPEARAFCEACVILLDPGERVGAGMSGYVYGGPMAEAVRRLKYGRRTELAPVLGALLAARAIELSGEVDAVVPVPLHRARLRRRGFNQAALLARPVAKTLAVPLVTSALVRLRDTPPQAGLDAAGRLRNVRGAFVAISAPAGRVLLVDDVRTTGATLAECAEALSIAGAERVLTLVLAGAEVADGR